MAVSSDGVGSTEGLLRYAKGYSASEANRM